MQQSLIMLVQESWPDLRYTLRALGTTHPDDQVFWAQSSAIAEEYLFGPGYQTRPLPSVVVMELASPSDAGLDLLRSIRRKERTKRVPVVVLSPSTRECDLVDSYEAGANSYLRMPSSPAAFMQVIADLADYWCDLNIRNELLESHSNGESEQLAG